MQIEKGGDRSAAFLSAMVRASDKGIVRYSIVPWCTILHVCLVHTGREVHAADTIVHVWNFYSTVNILLNHKAGIDSHGYCREMGALAVGRYAGADRKAGSGRAQPLRSRASNFRYQISQPTHLTESESSRALLRYVIPLKLLPNVAAKYIVNI